MKILAIDIGGTAMKYGLVDDGNSVIAFNEIDSNAKLGGKYILKNILNIADGFKGEFEAIGISTAGQVDSESGEILYANDNFPGYMDIELVKTLKEKYSVPVAIDNDVNCAAVAEAHFGAGKGCDNFLLLTYGTGIGGGIWLEGKLYSGADFSAGEVGYIVTHAGGRLCANGIRGCYEAYASTSALVSDVKEKIGKELNGRQIFAAENFGNPVIKAVVDNWIDEIVTGLISLIFSFNPSLIILGGGIMNEKYIADEVSRKIKEIDIHVFKKVQIRSAVLGNKAGMLGAAYNAKEKLK